MLEKVFFVFYSKVGKKGFWNIFEHKKMKKTRYIQRFTLIEMLVVVGIASLLFALLGPAFTRMTQSNAVEQHASGLKLGMERARALAVSNRRYVAMLLPDAIGGTDHKLYNFQRGGFRIGFVTLEGDDAKFDGWVSGNDWENKTSPDNNAFLTAVSSLRKKDLSGITLLDKFAESFKEDSNCLLTAKGVSYDEENPGSTISCRAIVFSPYGNVILHKDNKDVEIYFYITSAEVANCIQLRLNKLSGKVEYMDYEN